MTYFWLSIYCFPIFLAFVVPTSSAKAQIEPESYGIILKHLDKSSLKQERYLEYKNGEPSYVQELLVDPKDRIVLHRALIDKITKGSSTEYHVGLLIKDEIQYFKTSDLGEWTKARTTPDLSKVLDDFIGDIDVFVVLEKLRAETKKRVAIGVENNSPALTHEALSDLSKFDNATVLKNGGFTYNIGPEIRRFEIFKSGLIKEYEVTLNGVTIRKVVNSIVPNEYVKETVSKLTISSASQNLNEVSGSDLSSQIKPFRKIEAEGRKPFGFSFIIGVDKKLVVTYVLPDSIADKAKLRIADRINSMNSMPVTDLSVEAIKELVKLQNTLSLSVERNDSKPETILLRR